MGRASGQNRSLPFNLKELIYMVTPFVESNLVTSQLEREVMDLHLKANTEREKKA